MSAAPTEERNWRRSSGLASYEPQAVQDRQGWREVTRLATRGAPGSALIGTAGWLLILLAGGVLAVSYAGQFAYIYAARHQVIASNIEAGMLDVGMVVFALLGLGLALAGMSSRTERALVMVCALGSAGMGYAAADVASPRSVAAFVAPPLFLAIVVDRVIAVVRRHRLGDDEGSPWAPLGRAALWLLRGLGLVLLYTLRLVLDPHHTIPGLRRVVLLAAPLPDKPVKAVAADAGPDTKKARLLELYERHPAYRDRSKVSPTATELAPLVGLQAGTARTYLGKELDRLGVAP